MGVTIDINSLSLIHKGSGGQAICTAPDVCKTPAPPVPVPYVNVAFSKTLAKGTVSIKVDGGQMAAIKGSEYATSIGDEPGVAGGVVSGVNLKEATWITYSSNVYMEGKNVCRLTDKMWMNHQNTVCMSGTLNPPLVTIPGVKGTPEKCPTCKKSKGQIKGADTKPYDEFFTADERAALESIAQKNPDLVAMLPPKDGQFAVIKPADNKKARARYEKAKKSAGMKGEYHHPHPLKVGGCPIHQDLVQIPDKDPEKSRVQSVDDEIKEIVNRAIERNRSS